MSATSGKKLAALMFTDLVGSVSLQQRLGTEAYMRYVTRHDEVFQECLAEVSGAEILNETGDGFLVRFDDPGDAVNTALRLQFRLHGEMAQGERIRIRIGLHLGVVTEMEERVRGEKRAVGMPINLTARIMDLADGEQILMTRAVYEDARSYVRGHPPVVGGTVPALQWVAHGLYVFKGNPEPMEIFEVGVEGIAPLTAPEASGKAQRAGVGSGDHNEASGSPGAIVPEVLPPEQLEDSDVFIAYAAVDDTPLLPGKPGWISQFHDHLQVRLEQISGERVRVWRDVAPQYGTANERLLRHLPSAKTMVSVVSPPFMKAPACLRELETFWRSAERSGTFRVSNKARLMKVVKTPVQPGVAPPEVERLMAQLAGFDFFETDPDSGRVFSYDETFGEKALQRYFERVYDIAYELRDVLQALGTTSPLPSGAHNGNGEGKTVYLAECTSDLQMERDKLKRELLEHGHRVVPELPLPFSGVEFERDVRLLLREADIAVHLVGDRYGMVPEDAEGSVVEVQNRLAAERADGDDAVDFRRFIWMPRDIAPRNERQAAFVRQLVEDPAAHRGGEVIQDSMANFRQLLLRVLHPPEVVQLPVGGAEPGERSGVPQIYLIYDQCDQDAVEPLEDLLFELGFEVTGPAFEDDEAKVARIHQHNLLHCDGALVYYGAVTKPWVDMQLMDIVQAPGYGRTAEIQAAAVWVAPSDDRRKARFRTHLADVIRPAAPEVSATELEAFTARLRRREPAA